MATFHKVIKDSYLPNSISDQGFRKLIRPRSNQSRSIARVTNREDNKGINDFFEGVLEDFNGKNKPDYTTAVEYETLVNDGFTSQSDFLHLFNEYKKLSEGGKFNFFPPAIDYSTGKPIDNNILENFGKHTYASKPNLPSLNLGRDNGFLDKLLDAVNPANTIPLRINQQIDFKLHNSGFADLGDTVGATTSTSADPSKLRPIHAAPKFDKSAYNYLKDISNDFILPGIEKVPDNTISLVETNTEFIQSFMVGLNHEMSRELLWREYPTDQRGTYFSKFWDSTNYNPNNPVDRKDITPIHTWNKDEALGSGYHDPNTSKPENVVLLIRGELLRKFPNILIYAQKAGNRDETDQDAVRELGDETTIKWPIFEASVDPDIFFLGFDLTSDEVKGAEDGIVDPDDNNDNNGYYFVLRERPGETQFGSDDNDGGSVLKNDGRINDWDDMNWLDMNPSGGYINVSRFGPNGIYHDGISGNNIKDEEDKVKLNENTNSAQMAYALYQAPVLVAIHGSKMLKD